MGSASLQGPCYQPTASGTHREGASQTWTPSVKNKGFKMPRAPPTSLLIPGTLEPDSNSTHYLGELALGRGPQTPPSCSGQAPGPP